MTNGDDSIPPSDAATPDAHPACIHFTHSVTDCDAHATPPLYFLTCTASALTHMRTELDAVHGTNLSLIRIHRPLVATRTISGVSALCVVHMSTALCRLCSRGVMRLRVTCCTALYAPIQGNLICYL
jgi:hypothetical protein